MRTYAQTYAQLMNQGIAAGLSEPELIALRRTHEYAATAVDGMYRASGEPFLDHLTRTASIVMEQGGSQDAVRAAHLHAIYILHRFHRSRRAPPTASLRSRVAALVGRRAEDLIAGYGELRWSTADRIDGYRSEVARATPERRELFLLRLANELEDHLDEATLFALEHPLARSRERLAACARLARELGHFELSGELNASLPKKTVPSSLVFERRVAFARAPRTTWGPRYVAYRALRLLAGLIRRRS